MKLPIFVGLPRRKAPEWLVRISPTMPESRVGTVTFNSLVLVINRKGQYQARRVLPFGSCFRIDGCHFCNINFQSPPGGSGGVGIDVRPWIPEWAINLAVIVGTLLILGSQ